MLRAWTPSAGTNVPNVKQSGPLFTASSRVYRAPPLYIPMGDDGVGRVVVVVVRLPSLSQDLILNLNKSSSLSSAWISGCPGTPSPIGTWYAGSASEGAISRTLVRVLVLVLVLLLFRLKRPLISAGLDAVRWCKDPGLVLTGWKVKVSVLHHIRLDRETIWRHFKLDGVGGRESQRRSFGGKPGSKSGGSSPGPALVLTGGKVKVSMLYRVQ